MAALRTVERGMFMICRFRYSVRNPMKNRKGPPMTERTAQNNGWLRSQAREFPSPAIAVACIAVQFKRGHDPSSSHQLLQRLHVSAIVAWFVNRRFRDERRVRQLGIIQQPP